MKIKIIMTAIAVGVIGLTTSFSTPAQAAESASATVALSPTIVAALNAAPSGIVISADEVVWPDGTRLVTQAASRICTSGKYCAYTKPDAAGDYLEYGTCPAKYIPSLSIKSIVNKRTKGTVTARRGTMIIATITPGKTKNVANINSISCA